MKRFCIMTLRLAAIVGLFVACTPHHQPGAVAKQASVRFEVLGTLSAAAHGIAVDPQGTSIYVSDSFGRSGRGIYVCPLQTFTEDDCRYEARGLFNSPAGLFWDGNELLVSDVGSGRVSSNSVNPWTALETSWNVAAIWNVTKIGEELRGVTDEGNLVRLSRGSPPEVLKTGLHFPFGIAASSEGFLWVTEQNGEGTDDGNLLKMTSTGDIVQTISNGLRNPEGIASDDHGGVWLVETHLGELRHYNAAGEMTYQDLDTFAIPVSITRIPGTTEMLVFDVSGGKVVKVSVIEPQ